METGFFSRLLRLDTDKQQVASSPILAPVVNSGERSRDQHVSDMIKRMSQKDPPVAEKMSFGDDTAFFRYKTEVDKILSYNKKSFISPLNTQATATIKITDVSKMDANTRAFTVAVDRNLRAIQQKVDIIGLELRHKTKEIAFLEKGINTQTAMLANAHMLFVKTQSQIYDKKISQFAQRVDNLETSLDYFKKKTTEELARATIDEGSSRHYLGAPRPEKRQDATKAKAKDGEGGLFSLLGMAKSAEEVAVGSMVLRMLGWATPLVAATAIAGLIYESGFLGQFWNKYGDNIKKSSETMASQAWATVKKDVYGFFTGKEDEFNKKFNKQRDDMNAYIKGEIKSLWDKLTGPDAVDAHNKLGALHDLQEKQKYDNSTGNAIYSGDMRSFWDKNFVPGHDKANEKNDQQRRSIYTNKTSALRHGGGSQGTTSSRTRTRHASSFYKNPMARSMTSNDAGLNEEEIAQQHFKNWIEGPTPWGNVAPNFAGAAGAAGGAYAGGRSYSGGYSGGGGYSSGSGGGGSSPRQQASHLGGPTEAPYHDSLLTKYFGGAGAGAGTFVHPRDNPNVNPAMLQHFKDHPAQAPEGLPASFRTNNPGAISITGDVKTSWAAQQEGFVGTIPRPANEGGYYAKFATPEYGIHAQAKLLLQYQDKGRNTVSKILSTWAAKGQGSYITKVAADIGVGPNDPIDLHNPETMQRFLMAQAKYESGSQKILPYKEDVYARGARGQFAQRYEGAGVPNVVRTAQRNQTLLQKAQTSMMRARTPANMSMFAGDNRAQQIVDPSAANRPDHYFADIKYGDQTYRGGTGGMAGYASMPYGDYAVSPTVPSQKLYRFGAFNLGSGSMPDPKLGRNRLGIELHGPISTTDDKLLSEGCMAIAGKDWAELHARVLKDLADGKPVTLHVHPGADGHVQASIDYNRVSPNEVSSPSQVSSALSNNPQVKEHSTGGSPAQVIAGVMKDGSMTPDKIKEIAGKLHIQNSECVSLVKAWTNTQGVHASDWVANANVTARNAPPGTALATVPGGGDMRYAHGTGGVGGINRDHALIKTGDIKDANGKWIGFTALEQYNGSGGPRDKSYYVGGNGEHNADAYFGMQATVGGKTVQIQRSDLMTAPKRIVFGQGLYGKYGKKSPGEVYEEAKRYGEKHGYQVDKLVYPAGHPKAGQEVPGEDHAGQLQAMHAAAQSGQYVGGVFFSAAGYAYQHLSPEDKASFGQFTKIVGAPGGIGAPGSPLAQKVGHMNLVGYLADQPGSTHTRHASSFYHHDIEPGRGPTVKAASEMNQVHIRHPSNFYKEFGPPDAARRTPQTSGAGAIMGGNRLMSEKHVARLHTAAIINDRPIVQNHGQTTGPQGGIVGGAHSIPKGTPTTLPVPSKDEMSHMLKTSKETNKTMKEMHGATATQKKKDDSVAQSKRIPDGNPARSDRADSAPPSPGDNGTGSHDSVCFV